MSRDFIGSKIAIITKSQCRYVGTIIGIDSQTSSILLGNVKCFGTENRSGHSTNGHMPGTILPIMQFANSDIEDLKIVEEEQTSETSQLQQQQSLPMPVLSSVPPSQQPSIHDDPAIVSAVISSSKKENTSNSSISNRLMHNLQRMTLSDEPSKTLPKNEESGIRSNASELGPSWSLLSSSKWENNNNHSKPSSSQPRLDNKSKFFDDFISNGNNNTNQFQFNRPYQRSSNTHSTQTSRENGDHYNGQYDDSGLPTRQPFFSDDRPYPQKQQNFSDDRSYSQKQQNFADDRSYPQKQQHFSDDRSYPQKQQNRYQNGNMQYQQRSFYNNRRPQIPNQQRRIGGGFGGNRETFQDNPNDYDNDFDFETSNRKFNKLTNEDEFKDPTDLPTSQSIQPQIDIDSTIEHPLLYDKKKSFFDNLAVTIASDAPTSYNNNRSRNTDTFGFDSYQRQNNRSDGGGYRRSNNNYRQQQQYGNDDYHYRQHNNNNNNGYHYRY